MTLHQMPLHYAVGQKRPAMVNLLLELGADPLAVDGSGFPPAAYATTPKIDLPVMEKIRTMLLAELDSAAHGHREAHIQMMDLVAALALGDWELSAQLVYEEPELIKGGVLHLMAKRNHVTATKWLLDHGTNPNLRWVHWDAEVTALHLAILADHAPMVRLLLDAGADPTIRDSKHNSDALGWAGFFRSTEIGEMLRRKVTS